MLASLVALLAPPCCVACRRTVRVGARLCAACRHELPWIADPCRRCGLPRPCGAPCPAARAAFAGAWAPVAMEGPARALVHALKFRGLVAAADVMAAQIAANAPPGVLGAAPAAASRAPATLVPVPAHPGRRRARGFDHAALLAARLARRLDGRVLDALARPAGGGRQLGAGAATRRRGIAVEARRRAAGRVLLVDDVHTTGATLDACARALLAGGAAEVLALTYARTLP